MRAWAAADGALSTRLPRVDCVRAAPAAGAAASCRRATDTAIQCCVLLLRCASAASGYRVSLRLCERRTRTFPTAGLRVSDESCHLMPPRWHTALACSLAITEIMNAASFPQSA